MKDTFTNWSHSGSRFYNTYKPPPVRPVKYGRTSWAVTSSAANETNAGQKIVCSATEFARQDEFHEFHSKMTWLIQACLHLALLCPTHTVIIFWFCFQGGPIGTAPIFGTAPLIGTASFYGTAPLISTAPFFGTAPGPLIGTAPFLQRIILLQPLNTSPLCPCFWQWRWFNKCLFGLAGLPRPLLGDLLRVCAIWKRSKSLGKKKDRLGASSSP